MILIIPSIEISNNKCLYRIQGEKEADEYYEFLENHPFDLCKLFRLENVKSIHIRDIDSFDNTESNNFNSIIELTQSTFLPFQVSGNFQTIDECINLLEYGVHRVIISDMAINQPEQIKHLIKDYSGRRVVFSLPIVHNLVSFKHSNKSFNIQYYLRHLKELGATRVIYRELSENSANLINNKKTLIQLRDMFESWTLEFNVHGYEELKKIEKLADYNMDSVILGKTFYDTLFPCQEIWRLAESKLI